MTRERRMNPASPHLVFGLAIMAFGVVFTLDSFGLINAREYWRLWPLVLVATGLVRLVDSARTCGSLFTLSGSLLTAVGLALLLHNFDVIRIAKLWPLILFGVGAAIVWRAIGGEVKEGKARPRLGEWSAFGATSVAGSAPGEPSFPINRLDAFTFMGGVHRATSSQDFAGGSAMAVMGGCEIDLRNAALGGGRAVFDTFAMWGGIEIRVPDGWAVESHVVPLLGGFEDKTRQPADAKGRLVLTGVAIMGGVSVRN